MPVSLQYRKTGGSVGRLAETFLSGEIFFDTDVDGFFVGDSATPGGIEVANAHVTAVSASTLNIAATDQGKLFVFSNALGCAVAIQQSTSTYFQRQSGVWFLNDSPANVVITATTSLINGASTLTLSPQDSSVFVSDGTNYFALVTKSGISGSTPVNVRVAGNTTGATSSSTHAVGSITYSAAGGVSMGMSGSTLVVSRADVGATESVTALGNTTAVGSSTTLALGQSLISGDGDLSVGFSGSTLVLSAPSAATSGSGRNAVLLGNTTAATSSTVLTLTNLTISGGSGASVGFSTTAPGAGVVILSQAPIGGSANTKNMTAVGNMTGTTSSQVGTLTAETWLFGGALSGGFNAGTLVISGPTNSVASLSYFEPRPLLQGANSNVLNITNVYLSPFNLPAPLSFNRVRYIASMNYAPILGPVLQIQTTTTSDTLTASCSAGHTFTAALYTQVGVSQFTTVTTATVSTVFSVTGSVSRSSNSVSGSQSVSYTVWADTGTQSTSTSTSVSSTSSVNLSMGLNNISAYFGGVVAFPFGLSSTLSPSLNAVGIKQTYGSGQGTMSTGASYSAMPSPSIAPAFYNAGALGVINIKTILGQGVATLHNGWPYGAGAVSSAGSVLPGSYSPTNVTTTLNAAYGCLYVEFYTAP